MGNGNTKKNKLKSN